MAKETEIERLVVRLMGDDTSYRKMLKDAEHASTKTADVVKKMGTRMERVQKRLEGVGRAMKNIGRKMSMFITAPLAGVGALATRETVQFSGALSRLRSLVGMSAEEVADFRGEILALAPVVGKGPLELTRALERITSGGMRGKDALEALKVSAMAGSAGLGDTAEVGLAASLALAAYGSENLSATQAIEMLMMAAQRGNAEASQFAGQFGQLLPMAKSLDIGFEQVAGSMSFLTGVTGNASVAATGLKGVLRVLGGSTKEVRKGLEDLGFPLEKLRKIAKEEGIDIALVKLDEAVRSAGMEIGQIVTDQEAKTAIAQFVEQAATARSVIEDVGGSKGIVKTGFEAWSETPGAQMAKAMAGFKTVLIEIGDIIAPIMTKLISWTELALGVWKKIGPEAKKVIVVLAAVAAAIGPVLLTLGSMAFILPFAITAITTVVGFLGSFTAPVIAGFAAIGASIVLVVKHMGGLQAIFDYVKQKAMDLWAFVRPVFVAFGDLVSTIASSAWIVVSHYFNLIGGFIRDTFSSIFGNTKQTFTSIRDFIVDAIMFAEFAFLDIENVAALVWVNAQLSLVRFANQLTYQFTEVLPGVLNWFWENWGNIWRTGLDYALTGLMNLGQVFRNIFEAMLSPMSADWDAVFAPVSEGLFKGAINMIDKMPDIPKRIKGQLEKQLEAESSSLTRGVAKGYAEFRAEKIKELIPEIDKVAEEVENAAKKAGIPEPESDVPRKKTGKIGGITDKNAVLAGSAAAIDRLEQYASFSSKKDTEAEKQTKALGTLVDLEQQNIPQAIDWTGLEETLQPAGLG